MKSPLRKNLGKKNCELTPDIRAEIVRLFTSMEESDVSLILDNDTFGYWNVTVERPLRLRVFPNRPLPDGLFSKKETKRRVAAAIAAAAKIAPLDDWTSFAKATKLKAAELKKVRPCITETDPAAQPLHGEADPALRDTENIPLTYEGGIDAFIKNEVHPYAPDAYVNEKQTKIGYEISFTKYFYKPVELKNIKEILTKLADLENSSVNALSSIMEDF